MRLDISDKGLPCIVRDDDAYMEFFHVGDAISALLVARAGFWPTAEEESENGEGGVWICPDKFVSGHCSRKILAVLIRAFLGRSCRPRNRRKARRR